MTDFLEQFSNKNYRKDNKATQIDTAVPADTSNTMDKTVTSVELPGNTENMALNSDVQPSEPMKAVPSQHFSGVKTTEHDVVIDTSYNRHKTIRIITVSAAIVVLCFVIFFGYSILNRVQVLDFAGKGIAEARTWSLKNQIELDEQFKYDNIVDEDTILSQNILPGKKIAKKSVLTLKISKGADPDEKISVPDLAALSVPAIQSWIDDNKLFNTQLKQENSSTVASGKFIRVEFRDIAVDKDHFKRKDYLAIYISKGLTDMTISVTVPVFTQMSKSAADSWATTNNITLSYSPQISETAAQDTILSQDKEAGSTVQSGSTIRLAVSAGAGILIPDFSKSTKEDASTLEPGLVITVKTQYSNTIPYGKIISQSVSAGTRVLAAANKVTVIYSEGRPFIDNLVGTSEKGIAAYFYAYSLKGINIRYNITYVDSAAEKGQVVGMSKFNEFISINDTISIQISKGNLQ